MRIKYYLTEFILFINVILENWIKLNTKLIHKIYGRTVNTNPIIRKIIKNKKRNIELIKFKSKDA